MEPIIKTGARLAFLAALTSVTGCTLGTVYDTSEAALEGAYVTAYTACTGAGCAGAQIETVTPTGTLTGYKTTTDSSGRFFFDPYAELVPSEEAMALLLKNSDEFYKMRFSKSGYKSVWFDFTPEPEEHTYDGTNYILVPVPPTFMCETGAVDTDGDGICDAAEPFYGTSATSADTDDDGEYDDQEVFGTGSPFEVQTRSLLHFNINVSDFAVSKSFYELLGFRTLLESDVDVSDPAEAQGLNLPPYSLHAAPMILGGFAANADGFIIDLIRFYSPYDSEAPNAVGDLGMTRLDMQTENLAADMAALDAAGFEYDVLEESEGSDPLQVLLYDPDGVTIFLTQEGPVNTEPGYARTISGPTIYVSDLHASIAFYKKTGFIKSELGDGWATLYLSNERSIKLVESDSETPAYEDLNHLGIARVAIKTTNIDQDIAILEEEGISFYTSEAIDPSGPFSFLRYVCFEDPDGTVVELVEYK